MRTAIDLIVAKYEHQMEAQRAWDDLKPLDDKIIDLARVEKDENGKATIQDRDDLEPREGRNLGAVLGTIGGFVGLAFGPVGLLGAAVGTALGMAAGAVTGTVVADQIDTGIGDDVLNLAIQGLKPGSSVILVVVPETLGDEVVRIIDAHQAQIRRYDMNLTFSEKENYKKKKQ